MVLQVELLQQQKLQMLFKRLPDMKEQPCLMRGIQLMDSSPAMADSSSGIGSKEVRTHLASHGLVTTTLGSLCNDMFLISVSGPRFNKLQW